MSVPLLCSLVLVVLPEQLPTESATPLESVIDLARRSTVQVSGEWNHGRRRSKRWGGGVLIGRGDVVLTCLHIVEGYSNLYIQTHDHREHRGELLVTYADKDLAVLKFDSKGQYPGLVVESDPPVPGKASLIVGFPRCGERSVVVGKIDGMRGDVIYPGVSRDTPLLGFRAETMSGFSGGPVISIDGKFQGMVVARASDDVSLALSSGEVLASMGLPQVPLPIRTEALVQHEPPTSSTEARLFEFDEVKFGPATDEARPISAMHDERPVLVP